jgi:hypothetical protein
MQSRTLRGQARAGNSGGEIALDLANTGAEVAVSVARFRYCRMICWGSDFCCGSCTRRLPGRLVDVVNAQVLRLAIGDAENWDCAAQPRARGRWTCP